MVRLRPLTHGDVNLISNGLIGEGIYARPYFNSEISTLALLVALPNLRSLLNNPDGHKDQPGGDITVLEGERINR